MTTRIRSAVEIDRPIDEVFAYVTTAANWPAWHPSSIAVHGAIDHSATVGEEITEDLRVAGREGTAVWTVTAREAPYRWTIEGKGATGGRATITYHLTDRGRYTHFERDLEYEMPGFLSAMFDVLSAHRKIRHESEEAVRHLRRVIEALPPRSIHVTGDHAAVTTA
jgi:hypothetical protein